MTEFGGAGDKQLAFGNDSRTTMPHPRHFTNNNIVFTTVNFAFFRFKEAPIILTSSCYL